jgi:pyruvate-ferredoxin/flavodoxin oxidoreductase
MPVICGGRYGLSSKEFTPAMVKAVYDELDRERPRNGFTVGIHDDVSHTSLDIDPQFAVRSEDLVQALFYGLGADGTVGANKNTIKIIGSDPAFHAQGYFVYDSRKSGSQTVSHLRFGPRPIRSSYLVQSANFIGCHQFNFLERTNVLEKAARGATFLLNSPHGPDEVWNHLPRPIQQTIIDRELSMHVIDAYRVARDSGMGNRINTVMQTCFFALSGVLPREEAIARIKQSIEKTYGKKGEDIVRKNFEAVDNTLANLHTVTIPGQVTSLQDLLPPVPPEAPEFVRNVTAMMMSGRGDELPVSALPADGTYPTGTTRWEKRNISMFVPVWEPDICIQCGNCGFVCPHSVIRARFYDEIHIEKAPAGFRSAEIDARGMPDVRYTLQIYLEDCTGCGLCVGVCPARSKEETGRKAINMQPAGPLLEAERRNIDFFETLPDVERSRVDFSTVRGVQFLEPLFEFPGSCAGCGETPYLKLLSQLFGDRLIIANATGCSSIYGGNLPTTPWSRNAAGKGPAWSNSLFEDNAEFGLGFRLSADMQLATVERLLTELMPQLGEQLVEQLLLGPQVVESEIRAQRALVAELQEKLRHMDTAAARHLLSLSDHLVRRSIWAVGGDGWAYDIGSAGLDHVLSMGRDINVLVLDTEVYSNTGGQMSKATPLAAVAKFASGGKRVAKKDLAMQAISYGNVYVARVAMGANPQQTLQAFREAEAYPGPSLILAYSHCIAHGINMQNGLLQQQRAVMSGYWPLMRYNPEVRKTGKNPFELDSPSPRIPFKEYAYQELRYKMLTRTNPAEAELLMEMAQEHVNRTWRIYQRAGHQGEQQRDTDDVHTDTRSVTN